MAEPRRLAAVEDDDSGLIWEEPPTARRGEPILTAKQERALRAREGEWARVREYPAKTSAGTAASQANKGKRAPDTGRWQWKGVKHGDGSALYVRFLGD